LKVSVVQLNSKYNKEENLSKIKKYVEEAVDAGAGLVSLPEYCNYMGDNKIENAEEIPNGKTTTMLSEIAKKNKVMIHVGSIVEKYNDQKSYNTGFVLNTEGEVINKYRKIHLFDIEIKSMPEYKESTLIQGGEKPVTVDLPFGKAGLSICYDLRFPELFRNYVLNGAKFLFIPAAFTRYTGMLHWEPLLRARAIENQCYVIAAAQYGSSAPGKACYGNSLIIDPWGTVIANASEGEGIASADLKEDLVLSARESIPSVQNRKPQYYN